MGHHVGSIIYKLDYDLEKDFEPIGLVSNNPQLMVAKNDLPANTVGELVTWMKANPGKINFVNQNAAANVSGVLFENLTKQKVQFIPYRGAGPAMTDLISGTVDLLVVQGAVALPQIRAGKIKALANLSAQRSASMADIPTADETGVPGLYMSGWFGFWAPKGTPKEIIAKLQRPSKRWLIPRSRSGFGLGLDVPRASSRCPKARRVAEGRNASGGRSSRGIGAAQYRRDGKPSAAAAGDGSITGSTDAATSPPNWRRPVQDLIHGRDQARLVLRSIA
jgi:hypothetical protein